MFKTRTLALSSAALIFAGIACSDDTTQTTTTQLQASQVLTDDGVFSAMVAANYDIAQVATNSAAALGDPGTVALDTQETTDANAALVRLVGTPDINPADGGSPALTDLGGLNLVSNAQTDAFNAQATADFGSVADDLTYATAAQAEDQALLDLVDFALDPDNDGGATVTNAALTTEMTAEQTTLEADLNQATGVIAALNNPNPTTDTGTTGSAGTTGTSGTSGTSGTTGTSGTSGTTGSSGGCTEITVSGFAAEATHKNVFDGTLSPDQGSASIADQSSLAFYKSNGGSGAFSSPGVITLGTGDDGNYATCEDCVLVYQDPDASTGTPTKTYFQQSGTLNLTSLDAVNGKVSATLTDVTLVEVTIDANTFTSTPVAGGACLHIASSPVSVQ